MRYLIAAIMVVCMMAFTAQATAPPAHGGYPAGWGMQPFTWQSTSGSYNSGFSLYNPAGPGGGLGWINDWTDPNNPLQITYAPITLELWIEMYMIQTYWSTSYQWHRLGDAAETITFTIDGTVQSNEGCWILCTKDPNWDPDYLTFVHNIGVGDNNNQRDIPITWSGRWGTGLTIGGGTIMMPWTGLTWVGDELILDEVTACDRWFQFRGTFDLLYHEADGYYYLAIAGCPAPGM